MAPANKALPLVALGGLALWLWSRRDGAANLLGPGPAGEPGIGGGGGGYDAFLGYQSGFETGLTTGLGLAIPTGAGAGLAPSPEARRSSRFRFGQAAKEEFQSAPIFTTAVAGGALAGGTAGLIRAFRGGGAAARTTAAAARTGTTFGESVALAGRTGTRFARVAPVARVAARVAVPVAAGIEGGLGAREVQAVARQDISKREKVAQANLVVAQRGVSFLTFGLVKPETTTRGLTTVRRFIRGG